MRILAPLPVVMALSVLASCMNTTEAADASQLPTGEINGTIDSLVINLERGMTVSQASAIIGAFQDEVVDAHDPRIICRAYLYDEAIGGKYAHLRFFNGKLFEATEGHRAFCPKAALMG